MKAIGLDAAKQTGYAYKDQHDAWVTSTVDPYDTDALHLVLREAQMHGVEQAAVEWPYQGKSVRDYASLVESSVRCIVECERLGLKVVRVQASTWHAAYRLTGVREERQRGSAKLAQYLGAGPMDGDRKRAQDEFDAVMLCDYLELNSKHLGVECRGGT